MDKEPRFRWLLVFLGSLINLCMGGVYAFSVFRKPLENFWGISATLSGLPFTIFLGVFSIMMAVSGGLLERWGPRRTGFVGAILVGLGWILAGLSPHIWVLAFTYGVIGGAGVGMLYGAPIAVVARWFPDRKGLALGLTVMGFGLAPLFIAPIINALLGYVGPLRTFLYLGAAFLLILPAMSLPLRYPKPGWSPAKLPADHARKAPARELNRREMLRTSTFYALWGCFALGSLAGLIAVGIAAPFGQEVAGVSATVAAYAVSAFAVFNGLGRVFFGWLVDKIGPRRTAVFSFALVLLASLALVLGGRGNVPLYLLCFAMLWMNYGGWLAIAPAATAAFFGSRDYGRNYGIMFTAYGTGGILAGIISGFIRDLTGSYLGVFYLVMGFVTMGILLAFLGLHGPREVKRPLNASVRLK